eukprot:COSAG01_NODE_48_length_31904_cov_21.696997_5_plen_231_part_00
MDGDDGAEWEAGLQGDGDGGLELQVPAVSATEEEEEEEEEEELDEEGRSGAEAQELLAILGHWLSTTAPGVAHEQVQAFLSNDDIHPHDVLPDAPPAIAAAAVRFRGLRLRARRARYHASAAGIGELGTAACAGDLGAVRAACLERRVDPNQPSRLDGRTALWLAAEAGHTEVVAFLAEHGGYGGRHDMEGFHGAGWGRAGMLEARDCTALYGTDVRLRLRCQSAQLGPR